MSGPSPVLEQHKSGRWKLLVVSFLSFFCFFALITFSPEWHDKHLGVAQNEFAAVGSLRKITALESQYASAHSEKRFTCELSQPPHPPDVSGPHDPIAAQLSGEWSGYKFAIVGCAPEASGMVLHYNVTARPTRPYSTGVRAFCTNQSGKVFYDLNGSPSQCLALRQELPDLAGK